MQLSQGHRLAAVALSIFAFSLMSSAVELAAATQPLASPEITGSLPLPEAPYDQRAFITKRGTEGFELAARLHERGGLITRPISWRVFRLLTSPDGGGELIYEGNTPIADFVTLPGDYRIDIEYGFARFSRVIALEPAHHLSIAFNLNVGGLRVLSRLIAPAAVSFRTAHRIYSLSGTNRMHLVAENATPGDLLRLPAGRYRVESHLAPGNAIARTDIEVKPGVMSAVEIDHAAGIASLAFQGASGPEVKWQILDEAGRIAATADGSTPDVVLAPGDYQVKAASGAETLSRQITISAGQRLEVKLGH
ncbi:MAG TPA: hypothetical protein VET25_08395 [Aestuariivirgaceae bacterium]|nr:hypothetical protein [Aestuariivirgaceae bacterium]